MKQAFILCLFVGIISSCQSPKVDQVQAMMGQTMGTTYSVKIINGQVNQGSIDSLLEQVNLSLSTYIPESLISQFNHSTDTLQVKADGLGLYLWDNCQMSQVMYNRTNGAFDPTVMPLVNAWGFGYQSKPDTLPDSSSVRQILEYVGWDKIGFDREHEDILLTKAHPRTEIDFSAVAKGYGVDVVADFISRLGYQDFMVEIGGEVRCSGQPNPDRQWTIGITKPVEGSDQQTFEALVEVKNRAMATSGNYRNYRIVQGQKVSHSMNPKSGYPERNDVLSATIMAPTCAEADALATSCMILGKEDAQKLIKSDPNLEALLIFGEKDGSFGLWQTPGFPTKK